MMNERKLLVQRLGRVSTLRHQMFKQMSSLCVATSQTPLLSISYLTIGRRGDTASVLLNESELKARGDAVRD